MIFVTFDELRAAVDFSQMDTEPLTEGFKMAGGPSSRNLPVWTTMQNLHKDVEEEITKRGWDPETTLVLYEPPWTEEERKAAEEETRRQIEEDPDWDNIQIGSVNPEQVIASLYQNMTLDRLIQLLTAPARLKAFL